MVPPDARDRPALVAARRLLPDLSAQLRRRQSRRGGRPAGHHRSSGSRRRPRCRRHLAVAVLPLPHGRLRLRCRGLLRCRPAVRHAGGFRRPVGPGACTGSQGRHRPGLLPQFRPASVVPGEPADPQQPARGLVCLGGRQAGRQPAQQLAVAVRGAGLALGQPPATVLSAQLSRSAARPEPAQRRGPGCPARRGAVLARSRRRRLPPGRGQFLHPRSGPPGQSPGGSAGRIGASPRRSRSSPGCGH